MLLRQIYKWKKLSSGAGHTHTFRWFQIKFRTVVLKCMWLKKWKLNCDKKKKTRRRS